MPRLVLDAMGGDYAPKAVLEGVLDALPELEGELLLVGDEKVIRQHLSKRSFKKLADSIAESEKNADTRLRVRIVHAPDTIEMEDSIRAIRRKPNASINVGCQLAAQGYREKTPTVFISAGHSGAVMAAALLSMGRLAHVERPAIAVKLPTLSQDGCVMIDVGANVDCKPEHLRDFSVMGAIFAQAERKSPTLPKVGILSNGEERSKGNELTRSALEMIDGLYCFSEEAKSKGKAAGQFVGYAEGKEIFKGQVDCVVCDGFVGNVVLKSVEGLGSAIVSILKTEAKSGLLAPLGFLLSAGVFRRLKRKLDYAEYGAAPLLGVAGYVFICHGRSQARAIRNALLRAQNSVQQRFVERLEEALESASRSASPSSGTASV